MGTIADRFATAFRDFAIDGLRASGLHEVAKSDVRPIGALIESAIGAVGIGSLVGAVYATRANLNTDLLHPAGAVGLVYGDATDANNDLYIKVGASGTGSWTLTGALHSIMSGLAQPWVKQLQASFRKVDTYASRDIIPTGERFAGMLVYVVEAGAWFEVDPTIFDPDSPPAGDEGWRTPLWADPLVGGSLLDDIKALNIQPTVAGVTTEVDSDGAPIGFTIAAGQTGQSASILSYPLANKAMITGLAGKTIRIFGQFSATPGFLASKPLSTAYVDINRYVGQTGGKLVNEHQDGDRLFRTVEYTVVGNEEYIGLLAQISLAAQAIGTPMTLKLESISFAVVGDGAASIDLAIRNRAAGRFGASLILESQPAVGSLTSTAQFTFDPSTNFINGIRTPAGTNSYNSNISWIWLMAPEDQSLVRGARARITIFLETSLNYSRNVSAAVFTINRAGSGSFSDGNVLAVRKFETHQIFVIEGLIDAAAQQIIATIVDQTNIPSTVDEHFSIRDVQMEILNVEGGFAEGSQATMMLARNIAKRTKRALPAARVVVAADGSGDCLQLSDALKIATANQTIEIRDGIYTPSNAEPVCYPTFTNPNIRGVAGRPQIKFAQAANTAPAQIASASTSDFHLSCEVSNVHLIAKNSRYASHPDASGGYFAQELRFADCAFEHQGNEDARAYQVGLGNPASSVWSSTYAVGAGLGSGCALTYDRCEFLGYNATALYAHSWGAAADPFRVSIRNSLLDPQVYSASTVPQYSVLYQNLGSGQKDVIELIGNTLLGPIAAGAGSWQQIDPATIPANKMTFAMGGYGNTPAAYVLEDDGSRALRIMSATTGTASSVAVSGSAVAVLLGTALNVAVKGDVGLKGYLYGWLDVGDHPVGANLDHNVTQLGVRLGDCTAAAKVLTVAVDGGSPITVTFNQNYSAQSNATILAAINASLGSAAVADLFNVGELFRPRMTDEEVRVYNASTVTILRKRAVAWATDGRPNARAMTDTDPAKLFVGIAYEDIKPGHWGRVKAAGHVRVGMDVGRSDASTFVAGDTFGVSDGGGQFAKGAAIPLLTAISPSDVRFGA